MNTFRVASRAALRARPSALRVPAQRRTYAEAIPDKVSCPQPPSEDLVGKFRLLTEYVLVDQAHPLSPPPGTNTIARQDFPLDEMSRSSRMLPIMGANCRNAVYLQVPGRCPGQHPRRVR
jgi:hypothetical protein